MVRGKEARFTSSAFLPGGAPGWGVFPCSTAATCLVLGELPSLNLSFVTYLLGFLGLCAGPVQDSTSSIVAAMTTRIM